MRRLFLIVACLACVLSGSTAFANSLAGGGWLASHQSLFFGGGPVAVWALSADDVIVTRASSSTSWSGGKMGEVDAHEVAIGENGGVVVQPGVTNLMLGTDWNTTDGVDITNPTTSGYVRHDGSTPDFRTWVGGTGVATWSVSSASIRSDSTARSVQVVITNGSTNEWDIHIRNNTGISVTASDDCTLSFFVWLSEAKTIAVVDINGSLAKTEFVVPAQTWTRCVVTFSAAATVNAQYRIHFGDNGAYTARVEAMQFSKTAFAGLWVPTTTTTVYREPDTAKQAISDEIEDRFQAGGSGSFVADLVFGYDPDDGVNSGGICLNTTTIYKPMFVLSNGRLVSRSDSGGPLYGTDPVFGVGDTARYAVVWESGGNYTNYGRANGGAYDTDTAVYGDGWRSDDANYIYLNEENAGPIEFTGLQVFEDVLTQTEIEALPARLTGGKRYYPTVTDVPQSEANALVDLYYMTNPGGWTTDTGWGIDPVVNNWHGITVSGGHVTQIELNSNGLAGSVHDFDIPASLRYLYLYNTDVSGDISSWTLPASLERVSVHSTDVSGDISSWTLPASLEWVYAHNTDVSGDISSWTLPASLQYLYLYSTDVSGDISSWTLPASLQYLYLYSTSVSGDISSWTLPASLRYLYLNNTDVSGDISSWTLPASLERVSVHSTDVSGDISSWTLPASLEWVYAHNTDVSGDISSWTLPASLQYLYLYSTDVSGDISSWTLPASLQYLYLYSTSVSGSLDISAATGILDIQLQDCGLTESEVDGTLQSIYTNRASFTYATPEIDIGGTNADPSGTYQDGDPPTTGKEYAYEVENDPETEGFNTWSVTY